jgi:hypothetical protein
MRLTLPRGSICIVVAIAGCGPMYRFEIRSPDVSLSEDEGVVYRILDPSGTGGGGIDAPLKCRDGGATCVSMGWHGQDEIEDGAEIMVWFDFAGDDFDEWHAADLPPDALQPDAGDPVGHSVWHNGLGSQTIDIQLVAP